MKKLSVVMPVYNVAEYLQAAVESVLAQKYSDYEIIFVDDCSPDESDKICKRYCEKYDFIRYIKHSENKGLSQARNTGMENADGEYIWFMDPDDCLEGELFSVVFQKSESFKADVVVFGFKEKYLSKSGELTKTVEIPLNECEITENAEIGKKIIELEKLTAYGYAWNKFYRLENIKKSRLLYEDIPLTEDIKFNIKYFDTVNSVAVLDITPYCYFKRQNASLTAKFVPRYFEVHRERVYLLSEQAKRFDCYGEDTKKALGNIFVRYIFSAISRNCDKRSCMSHRDRKNWLKDLFDDSLFKELIPFANAESLSLKVMIKLLKSKSVFLCLSLGCFIYLIQNKLKGLFIKLKQNRN